MANESGESVSCFLSEAFAEGENCSVIADEGGEMSSKSESWSLVVCEGDEVPTEGENCSLIDSKGVRMQANDECCSSVGNEPDLWAESDSCVLVAIVHVHVACAEDEFCSMGVVEGKTCKLCFESESWLLIACEACAEGESCFPSPDKGAEVWAEDRSSVLTDESAERCWDVLILSFMCLMCFVSESCFLLATEDKSCALVVDKGAEVLFDGVRWYVHVVVGEVCIEDKSCSWYVDKSAGRETCVAGCKDCEMWTEDGRCSVVTGDGAEMCLICFVSERCFLPANEGCVEDDTRALVMDKGAEMCFDGESWLLVAGEACTEGESSFWLVDESAGRESCSVVVSENGETWAEDESCSVVIGEGAEMCLMYFVSESCFLPAVEACAEEKTCALVVDKGTEMCLNGISWFLVPDEACVVSESCSPLADEDAEGESCSVVVSEMWAKDDSCPLSTDEGANICVESKGCLLVASEHGEDVWCFAADKHNSFCCCFTLSWDSVLELRGLLMNFCELCCSGILETIASLRVGGLLTEVSSGLCSDLAMAGSMK